MVVIDILTSLPFYSLLILIILKEHHSMLFITYGTTNISLITKRRTNNTWKKEFLYVLYFKYSNSNIRNIFSLNAILYFHRFGNNHRLNNTMLDWENEIALPYSKSSTERNILLLFLTLLLGLFKLKDVICTFCWDFVVLIELQYTLMFFLKKECSLRKKNMKGKTMTE